MLIRKKKYTIQVFILKSTISSNIKTQNLKTCKITRICFFVEKKIERKLWNTKLLGNRFFKTMTDVIKSWVWLEYRFSNKHRLFVLKIKIDSFLTVTNMSLCNLCKNMFVLALQSSYFYSLLLIYYFPIFFQTRMSGEHSNYTAQQK